VPVEVTKIVEKIVEVPAGEAEPAGPVTLEVYDPFGPLEVTQLFAPRLDTLDGKTIAYAEGTWLMGRAKPLVLDLLQKQFPTLKVVDIPDYTEIRQMKDEQVAQMLKEKDLDAVIVGNAG
jgi:ABC-type amino acid transport substrate-binding protein